MPIAAISIDLFQCPWDVLSISRSPRGARPRRRLMLILAPPPCLVDEDQASWIERVLFLLPLLTPLSDIGSFLLGRVDRLF